jgi:hypothetical protein
MKTEEMLKSHPRKANIEMRDVTNCIEACRECAVVCTSCADACLGEQNVQKLVPCIRIDLDCADICQTTARMLMRQTETNLQLLRAQLETTITATRLCAEECEKHAEMHQHCRVCASSCRNCEQMCQQMLTTLQKSR